MQRILIAALLATFAITASVFVDGSPFVATALADDDDDDGASTPGSGGNRYDDDDDDRRPRRPRAARPVPAAITVPGEIVIGRLTDDDLARIVAEGFLVLDSAPLQALGNIVARVRLPPRVDLATARARILAIVPAAIVEPNHLYRPVEMRCRANDCPAFAMIGWSVPPSQCNLELSIGMIDTRINLSHDAFAGQAVETFSLLADGERPSATVHGTAIAALLVGNVDSRTPGLLPESRLVAVEAFHRDGAGDAADAFKLVRAIDFLAGRDIRVVNLSFAGPQNGVLEAAVEGAAEAGMMLVAAAGNNGPKAPPSYPAAYDAAIAVTAVDTAGRVFRQAGRGEHIAFAAPGVRLWTAASISGGRYRSGTSYAVPFVTAAVAAALARGEENPEEIVDGLANQTIDLGPAGRDPVFGWGLVRSAC